MQSNKKNQASSGKSETQFVHGISDEEAYKRAELLKALADPTRLRILHLLKTYEGLMCVDDIVETFLLEQPTISHHLAILRRAGLIYIHHRSGLWVYYAIRQEPLADAIQIIYSLDRRH